jgi:hypothetical protein
LPFSYNITAVNKISRQLIATVIAVAFLSPVIVQAGSRSHGPLSEYAALDLLLQTIKRDNVYAKRISLDCVTFATEETTRIYFEVVLRENHNAKCGGDPDLSPAIDRYRVNRASGKIEWLDRVADKWQPYNPARIR